MRDEKELFAISTRLLTDTIQPMAMRENIAPSDVVAILTIILGRISGRMGYYTMTEEQYWKEVTTHGRVLFQLGFDSERQAQS